MQKGFCNGLLGMEKAYFGRIEAWVTLTRNGVEVIWRELNKCTNIVGLVRRSGL